MKPYIIIFLLQTLVTFGQDTLNKYDSKGRKTGYWKVFFDQHLNATDSSQSYFIMLMPYDKGKAKIGSYNYKWRKNSVICDQTIPQKGEPVLLNGTFKWYDKKTNLLIVKETYINGYPTYFSCYSPNPLNKTAGIDTVLYLWEFVDYTRRFDDAPGSCYYYESSAVDANVKEYSYRKINGKWKYKRIIEISTQPLEKEIIGTWIRTNEAKKGKTLTFNMNDSALVYFNDPSIPVDKCSYEVLSQNRIILRKVDTYSLLKVAIINGRLRIKSSIGKELYVRKT